LLNHNPEKMLKFVLFVNAKGVTVPTQLGAILVNVETQGRTPFSTLIPHDMTESMLKHPIRQDGKAFEMISIQSKQISPEALARKYRAFNDMVQVADIVVAQNAPSTKKTITMIPEVSIVFTKPWIDTMRDFQWPGNDGFMSFDKMANLTGSRDTDRYDALGASTLLSNAVMSIPNWKDQLLNAIGQHESTDQKGAVQENVAVRVNIYDLMLINSTGDPLPSPLSEDQWNFLEQTYGRKRKKFVPFNIYKKRRVQ